MVDAFDKLNNNKHCDSIGLIDSLWPNLLWIHGIAYFERSGVARIWDEGSHLTDCGDLQMVGSWNVVLPLSRFLRFKHTLHSAWIINRVVKK